MKYLVTVRATQPGFSALERDEYGFPVEGYMRLRMPVIRIVRAALGLGLRDAGEYVRARPVLEAAAGVVEVKCLVGSAGLGELFMLVQGGDPVGTEYEILKAEALGEGVVA